MVVAILMFIIVFALIVYALVQQGILGGFNDMLGIGGDWLGKLFSPA